MKMILRALPGILLVVAGCAARAPTPIAGPVVPSAGPPRTGPHRPVRAAMLGGEAPVPVLPQSVQFTPQNGDIGLNFPSADVRIVAKATLGDILHVPWTVAADVTAPVNVVTMQPIARASLVPFLENALKTSGLAMVAQDGGFAIMPIASARSSGTVAPETLGYGTEIIKLEFVSVDEMRKMLDSVVPGTVTSTDANRNSLVIAGTTGQRSSARALLKQFDVN